MMSFRALDVALLLVKEMKDVVKRVAAVDADLADQMTRCLNSIALNVGEGSQRVKGDRLPMWRIAAGSAKELQVAIRVAAAWGHVDETMVKERLGYLGRELAILWRMGRNAHSQRV